jgi:long-chain acyl-CoA synthetase
MCFLPLFHCFGQNFIMNASINAGATLVLHRRFDAEEILASVVANKVTMFLAVPTVFRRLLQVKNVDAHFADVLFCCRTPKYSHRTGMATDVGHGH